MPRILYELRFCSSHYDLLSARQQATRKLKEAVAREGVVVVKERSEVEDSKEMSKERRKAVGASSKPRRQTMPRVRRRPRAKANGVLPSRDRNKSTGLPEAKGGNTVKEVIGNRKIVADRGSDAAGATAAAAAAEPKAIGVSRSNDGGIGSGGGRSPAAMEEEDDDMDMGFVYDSDSWPSADTGNESGVVPKVDASRDAAADTPRISPGVDDYMDNGGDDSGLMVQSPLDSDKPDREKISEGGSDAEVSNIGCSDSEAKGEGRGGSGSEGGRAMTREFQEGGAGDDIAGDEGRHSGESGGAVECSLDDFAGILEAMGVEDIDRVKSEGRAELEKLLKLSRGNVALAVEWFFERATKTKAKEKVRVSCVSVSNARVFACV